MTTPYFFLYSDSPFNYLNDSIQILLSYISKIAKLKYEALCIEYFKAPSQVRDFTDVFCIKSFRKS
jgi:hypothetical protein